jgi:formate hydrogenlyase subunit 3/multisubunit Na+/H+ antiporter MnhD subunit
MTLFFLGVALLLAAAIAAWAVRAPALRDRAFTTLVVAGAVAASVPAWRVFVTGGHVGGRWPSGLPGGDWVFGIDALSALFLLAVLGVGAASAACGAASLRSHGGVGHRGDASSAFGSSAFALLVLALALVVTAESALPFLCAWELMAIGSFLLIVTEHEHAEVRRAGLIYLVATHTGTLLLFVMFAYWGRATGDWSFAALAAARPGPAWGGAPLFLLALGGFGVKAGLVPLHFWLPPAHAAAPSHVSALMSGVVIKTGIYGLLRVAMLAGTPPLWWGWVVLGLGVASAVLGVLWALAQHDLKRLLAYHSVENVGIILMGVGVGALGSASGHPALAALGYGAAVLHTVNHALFKALLFLSAGAVYHATGTRNMEELGGLARRMPVTWVAFLVGSVAIVGLPPLNGFVSEWLVYLGLFRAGEAAGGLRLALLGAPALALVGGLALACFAKVAGVVFLGRPRGARPLEAREPGAGVLLPPLVLAGACAAIGLAPGAVVPPFLAAGAAVAGAPSGPASAALSAALRDVLRDVPRDAQRIAAFAAWLLFVSLALGGVRWAVLRRRRVRADQTWACGYGATTPRMQYTASSFAAPLLALFGGLSGVAEHRGATVFHSTPRDLVLDDVALPLWARVQRAALRLRPMQQGRLHLYLLYIVAALLVLLVYLVAAPGA